MKIQRRTFFQGVVAALLTGGSLELVNLDKNKKNGLMLFNKELEKPVKLSVKYFPAEFREKEQIRQDVKSWGNENKYNEIINKLEIEGQLLSIKEYNEYSNYHESVLYFKNSKALTTYNDMLKKSSAIDLKRQKELGYKVICNIS